ncbi:MAG: hypothetical protein WCD42_03515 [Rhizomicrobium sp.]
MTSWFTPGSIPWLLAYEILQALRALRSENRPWAPALMMLTFLGLMFAGGWDMAGDIHPDDLTLSAGAALTAGIALLFVFSLMLSASLTMVIAVFYERGDFDLTLSSPLPPDRILFVRALSLALSAGALYAFFTVPLILPLAIRVSPRFLCTLGLIGGLMLCVSAIGLWLTMGLIRLVGIKATRLTGHVLAGGIGFVLFSLMQVQSLFPATRPFFHHLQVWFARGFSLDVWWCLPLKAFYGDPLVNGIFFVTAALLFVCSVRLLGTGFAVVSARAAGLSSGRRVLRTKSTSHTYLSAWVACSVRLTLVRKEWVTVWRNPSLLVYVIVQVLSFLPMVCIIIGSARSSGHAMAAACTFFIVMFACIMVGALTVLFVMAEDAPELMATSPLSRDYIRQAKMTAVFIPVVAVFALPVLFLIYYAPWAGVMAAIGTFFACVSTAYVCLWYEKPVSRKALVQRKARSGNLIAVLGPLGVGVTFGAVTEIAATGSFWALLAALVPVALLGGFYYFRRQDV